MTTTKLEGWWLEGWCGVGSRRERIQCPPFATLPPPSTNNGIGELDACMLLLLMMVMSISSGELSTNYLLGENKQVLKKKNW